MWLVPAIGLLAQDRMEVSGTVLNKAGEPVIGANVMEKVTQNGAVVDMDGNWSIRYSFTVENKTFWTKF